MKKVLIFIFLITSILLLTYSVSADEYTSALDGATQYYIVPSDSTTSPGVYDVFTEYNPDNTMGMYSGFICFLFAQEYFDYLGAEYDNYCENNGGASSFNEYMGSKDYAYSFDGQLKQSAVSYEEMRKEVESSTDTSGGSNEGSDGTGGSDGGTEGDGTGDGGSDSTGSNNGVPNITVDGTVTSEPDGCDCNLGSAHNETCYQSGFIDGWNAFINSSNMEQALQDAFDQGFREVNTESWSDTVEKERSEAVEEYKTSEEYQQSINQAKEQAVTEYRSSETYVSDFKEEIQNQDESSSNYNNCKEIEEFVIEEFKNSSEQAEIIGQAKEDAVADFVVEVESVLSDENEPSEGAATDMVSVIEQKIAQAEGEAVEEFVTTMESIISEGDAAAEGTPEGDLQAVINQQLDVKYSEGKEQGKADYKSSIEHKTALKSEYNAGAAAGHAEGYQVGCDDGYAQGLIDGSSIANTNLYDKGKTDYLMSEEYRTTIQTTYNSGYNDGEKDGSSVNITALVITALSLSFILAGITLVTVIIKKKKFK